MPAVVVVAVSAAIVLLRSPVVLVLILVVPVTALVVVAPMEVPACVVVVVVPTTATVSHAASTPGRGHAERFTVELALQSPVDAWLALAIRLRLARNVVEERLGLVVPVRVILWLLLSGARLVAGVILLLLLQSGLSSAIDLGEGLKEVY